MPDAPDVLDLDALDIPPLPVKLGGHEYLLDVTVGAMKLLDQKRAAGEDDPWSLTFIILEEAGVSKDAYDKLGIEQIRALGERINSHFFPNAEGGENPEGAAPASPGLTSLPGSSAPSVGATSTGMTLVPDVASGT